MPTAPPAAPAVRYGLATERRCLLRLALPVVVLASVSACASGPSPTALANGLPPPSTTETTAAPEGVAVIRIVNGTFRPSTLAVDPGETPVVEWRHEDDAERIYVIEARDGSFASPALASGDTFRLDVSEIEPGLIRYFTTLGRARIPGSVDTRPGR